MAPIHEHCPLLWQEACQASNQAELLQCRPQTPPPPPPPPKGSLSGQSIIPGRGVTEEVRSTWEWASSAADPTLYLLAGGVLGHAAFRERERHYTFPATQG